MGIKVKGMDFHGGPIKPSAPVQLVRMSESPEYFAQNPIDMLRQAQSSGDSTMSPEVRLLRALTAVSEIHIGSKAMSRRERGAFPGLLQGSIDKSIELGRKYDTGTRDMVFLELRGDEVSCLDTVAGAVIRLRSSISSTYARFDEELLQAPVEDAGLDALKNLGFYIGEAGVFGSQVNATNVHQLLEGRLTLACEGAAYILSH